MAKKADESGFYGFDETRITYNCLSLKKDIWLLQQKIVIYFYAKIEYNISIKVNDE